MSTSIEPLLPYIQASILISLLLVAGLASCLSLWVIPIILHPPNSARSKIEQFAETVSRGIRFIQPTGRIQILSLLAVSWLTSQHSDADVAATWMYYAAAGGVYVQAVWYEVFFIFPINDEIRGLRGKLEGDALPRGEEERLRALLRRWQARQWVRVVLPLASAVIVLATFIEV